MGDPVDGSDSIDLFHEIEPVILISAKYFLTIITALYDMLGMAG